MSRSSANRIRAGSSRRQAHRLSGKPVVRRDAKPCVEALERRALLASITEYPIPAGSTTLGGGLYGITGGPDGNVYFTDTIDNAIGQITPAGVITKLPLPPYSGGAFYKNGLDGITLGADGELAFTESTQGAIGKMTTAGAYSQYPIGSSGSLTGQGPDQITKTSDGTLWWTEDGSNAIGELTPAGVFNQYPVANAYSGGIIGPSMKGITVGSDGNIWITNWGPLGDFIGKITPSGVVTEYTLPGDTSPVGIVGGPAGNLWFVASGTNTIDVMSTSGTMLHQYPVTVTSGTGGLGHLADITVGSDNNLYFTAQTGYIGEITTSDVVSETPVSTTVTTVPNSSGPQPLAITSGPDGNIWFTDPWTDSIGELDLGTTPPPPPPPPPPEGGTTTSLQANTLSTVYGQPVTLSATVSLDSGAAGTPVGSVTFYDGTANLGTAQLSGGTASLTTNALPVGSDAITASYGGASQYGGSLSASSDVTVQKDATSVAISSSRNPLLNGQPLTLRVVVGTLAPGGGTPTGTVTFLIDQSRSLGTTTLAGGGASFTTLFLPLGSHVISVAYNGDADFLPARPASVRATGTVPSFATRTVLTSSAPSATYGKPITLTATVLVFGPVRGRPTGSVNFMSGANVLGFVSLKRGRAVFKISSLPLGSKPIRVIYAGSVFTTNFGTTGSFAPSSSQTVRDCRPSAA